MNPTLVAERQPLPTQSNCMVIEMIAVMLVTSLRSADGQHRA